MPFKSVNIQYISNQIKNMILGWNEIKSRAFAFCKEWEGTEREEAEAKPFLIEFLNIFGITRKRVSTFEHKVKKLGNTDGYIDLLWKGTLLVEMKSKGKDLDKAYLQAKEYCHGLKEHEIPKMIMVSDFYHFQVYDEEGNQTNFTLPELVKNIQVFGILANYQKRTYKEQDPVNIAAAEVMGKLHDKLKDIGYTGHPLELYLVRLLFCLFADDTSIFEKGIFLDYIELKTNEDGSDLAAHISQLFQILNTHEEKRLKNIDEALNAFPYINGKLFEEPLPMAGFDSEMRKILLQSCALDWGKISPAIFGSLFQSVMNEKARRNLGAHYTSEKNILKVIKPLFLDDLWKEFEAAKNDKRKLQKLHDKISKLRFLDPACGCGNFLIISYRELRLLELEIVKILLKGQQVTSINDYFLVDVDQFYGIEYEEFPSQIAQVAMWLMDHQMNEMASIQFGDYYKRIPLKKSATIVCGNALRIDWQSLINPMPWEKHSTRYHYIFGNPPFIGQHLQNAEQKLDMQNVFVDLKDAGVLDYVTPWYIKAAQYLNQYQIDENGLPRTCVGFVSTNSITQGEQVGILWNQLFNKFKVKIHFAHRTFKWGNEAKGNAAVHVVIIGFSNFDISNKLIYEYTSIKAEPHELKVRNINAYLVEGNDFFLPSISKPINKVHEMKRGNSPYDSGYYLFAEEEKNSFVSEEPGSNKFFKKFLGAKEFINGIPKWCLWLKDADPSELKRMPLVIDRIKKVKEFRENSPGKETQSYARTPSVFRDKNNPDAFIVVPRVSSENRKYIPIGFFDKYYIPGDTCMTIMDAQLYDFGILTSEMHMTWVKYICGRLKSDYRYSKDIVYNNYPWPENPTDKQKESVEKAAQGVLDARLQFPNSSLADLYDPNTMPPVLVKAHQALDKAVDLCYRPQPFTTEAKRIEFLFELYDKYTAGLFVQEKIKKVKKTKLVEE
jgi:hypothetical protein